MSAIMREQYLHQDLELYLEGLDTYKHDIIKSYLVKIDYNKPIMGATLQCIAPVIRHILTRILMSNNQVRAFYCNQELVDEALKLIDVEVITHELDVFYDRCVPVVSQYLSSIDAQANMTELFADNYVFRILEDLDAKKFNKHTIDPDAGKTPDEIIINRLKEKSNESTPMITKFMENIDKRGFIGSIDPASDTPDVKITRVYSDKISGVDGVAIGKPAFGEMEHVKSGNDSLNIGKPALSGLEYYYAEKKILGGYNNVLFGFEAGLHFTTESNKVIIGDNIRSMNKTQSNVLFIGDHVAIGKTLFGKPINLFDVITEYYNATRNQESL